MIIERMNVGVYGANCYIVASEKTREGFIVDPGGHVEEIMARVADLRLKIRHIILTHSHGDHTGGLIELKEELGADVLCHVDEVELLEDPSKNLSMAMSMVDVSTKPEIELKDEEKLNIGGMELKILHTPGHTPGSISIIVENHVFTGDTLFARSIGRSDLYKGNGQQLINSIKEKLMILNGEMVVHPGHGPESTIEIEKKLNPFLRS